MLEDNCFGHTCIFSPNRLVFMQLVFAYYYAEATSKIVMYNLFGNITSRLVNLTGYTCASFPKKYLRDIFVADFLVK